MENMVQTIKEVVRRNKPLLLVMGVLTTMGLYNWSQKKRVFISFAIEDRKLRDIFVGQARNKYTPFDFVDMSVKSPWDSAWKTKCRERIRECDGVIALLSKKTWNAEGARWEMKCAIQEGIPIIGVHIHRDEIGAIPPELKGQKVIYWDWEEIGAFINSL